MQKRLIFPIAILILSILACSIPGTTETPVTEPPGGPTDTPVPGGATDTPTEPTLPPPPLSELRVTYAKAGNIWLWTESGAPTQLTFSGGASSPKISSDGAVVAFLRGGELWAVNSDGSGERLLAGAAYLNSAVTSGYTGVLHWFGWQPFTHTIFFGLSEQGEAYTIPIFDLHRVDADAGVPPYMLLAAGAGGLGTFSPDGLHLALAQPEHILLFDPVGGSVANWLTFEMVMTYSEWFYLPDVTWTADSSRLFTVIPAHDSLGVPTEPTEVWYAPLGSASTMVDSFVAVPVFMDTPRLSPDGMQVLYMKESGGSYVLTMRTGGGAEAVVLTVASVGDAGTIGWSPDSLQVVYWNPMPVNALYGSPSMGFSYVSDVGTDARYVRWTDPARLIFLAGSDLRLRTGPASGLLIDSAVESYDFVIY